MRLVLPLLSMLTLVACAHSPQEPGPAPSNGVPTLSEAEYHTMITANTAKANQYQGLYQTFQADVTILSTEVRTAGVKLRAAYMQWDPKQYNDEREKILQDNSAYAHFFLRFFAPEHDYDDLQKPKSIWKVYLEVANQRFDGKIKKTSDKFVEIQSLFPHMDRFSTPYEVTFSVPMSTVESSPCKVVLTSSLGTAEFQFPVKK